jgi:hypothetical protein
MKKSILALATASLIATCRPASAQAGWTAEVGGGTATPVSDIGSRLSSGWNLSTAAGYQFGHVFALLGDFEFSGMGVPGSVLQEFSAPDGHGRILALSVDPRIAFPLTRHVNGFVTGGVGWIHRSVELTSPSISYYDYYDPFYGDVQQPVESDQVLSSVTRNALGENIGGGIDVPLRGLGFDLFASVRYFHAPTLPRTTALIPVTFGIRWTSGNP